VAVEPDGGDAACWLDHVCDNCGRLIEDPAVHECDAPAERRPASQPAN
jgi:uncharacterized protein